MAPGFQPSRRSKRITCSHMAWSATKSARALRCRHGAISRSQEKKKPGQNTPPSKVGPRQNTRRQRSQSADRRDHTGIARQVRFQWNTRWPGITFPIGSTIHLQLLAAPTIKPIAWMLITHKALFGKGIIGSITVFDRSPPGELKPPHTDAKGHRRQTDQLTFLIYVQQNTPQLNRALNENSHYETSNEKISSPKAPSNEKDQASTETLPDWPWKMRPTTEDGMEWVSQKPEDSGTGGSKPPAGGNGKDQGASSTKSKGKGKSRLLLREARRIHTGLIDGSLQSDTAGVSWSEVLKQRESRYDGMRRSLTHNFNLEGRCLWFAF